MSDDQHRRGQPDEGGAEATTDGAGSTDRGGSDAGSPGQAAGGSRRYADSPGTEPADSAAPPPGSNIDQATNTVTGVGPSS